MTTKLSYSEAVLAAEHEKQRAEYIKRFESDPAAYTAPLATEDADSWAKGNAENIPGIVSEDGNIDRSHPMYRQVYMNQFDFLQRRNAASPFFKPQYLSGKDKSRIKDVLAGTDEDMKGQMVQELVDSYDSNRLRYVFEQLDLPEYTARLATKLSASHPKLLSTLLAATDYPDQVQASMEFSGIDNRDTEVEIRNGILQKFRDHPLASSLFEMESMQIGSRKELRRAEDMFVTVARAFGKGGEDKLMALLDDAFEVVEYKPNFFQQLGEGLFYFEDRENMSPLKRMAESTIHAGQAALHTVSKGVEALDFLIPFYEAEEQPPRVKIILEKNDPAREKWAKVLPSGIDTLSSDQHFWGRIALAASNPMQVGGNPADNAIAPENREWLRNLGISNAVRKGDSYIVTDTRAANPNGWFGAGSNTETKNLSKQEFEALIAARQEQFRYDVANNTRLVGNAEGYHLVRFRGGGDFDGNEVVASFTPALIDGLVSAQDPLISQRMKKAETDIIGAVTSSNAWKHLEDSGAALRDLGEAGYESVPKEFRKPLERFIFEMWRKF